MAPPPRPRAPPRRRARAARPGPRGEVRVKDAGARRRRRARRSSTASSRRARRAGEAAPVKFESFQKIIAQQAARILQREGRAGGGLPARDQGRQGEPEGQAREMRPCAARSPSCCRPARAPARRAAAAAWPAAIMESLARDARRLVPRTPGPAHGRAREGDLRGGARLAAGARRRPSAADLPTGRLRPETIAALEAQADEALALLRERRVERRRDRELGALLRIAADLSDPVLTGGPEGYPPGVTREYYAFVAGEPRQDPGRARRPARARAARAATCRRYWQALLGRSRVQSPVIRTELFRSGRVVDHRTHRLPLARSSASPRSSYSRAVTAIAATWLAVWREARGDLTRTPTPATAVQPQRRAAHPGTPGRPQTRHAGDQQ